MMKVKDKKSENFQNEKYSSLDSRIPINTKQEEKNQDKLYAKDNLKSSQRD